MGGCVKKFDNAYKPEKCLFRKRNQLNTFIDLKESSHRQKSELMGPGKAEEANLFSSAAMQSKDYLCYIKGVLGS